MSSFRPFRYFLPLLLILTGCAAPNGVSSVERIAFSDGWLAMGTFFEIEIRIRPEEADRAREWILWARDEISRLENVYSRHDPESAVSNLNRTLAREDILTADLQLDTELEAIVFAAIEIWEESGGAFDMTIGPLVDVWTDAVEKGRWPSVAELRHAKGRLGSEAFLFLGDGKLKIVATGIRVDLDGISKGSVLDHLREKFETDLPDAAALLNFGESSLFAIGDPDGDGWRLRIRSRDPSKGDRRGSVIRLRNQALSVSSSLGKVSEIGGEKVSHVIDPRTGSAISGGVESFVIADRAMIADGWSTALLVMGANRTALRLLQKAGLEANVLESSGRSISTDSWEEVFVRP